MTLTTVKGSVLNRGVNVKDYGAVGDGVTDDTAAIQAAIDSGAAHIVFPKATYYAPNFVINRNNAYENFLLEGNGSTITGTTLSLQGLFQAEINGFIFDYTSIYIESIRYSSFDKVQFTGVCYIGKHTVALGLGTWSIYWNSFNDVRFSGVDIVTSQTDASFNSNIFNNCEFRKGTQTNLFELSIYSGQGAFSSNTFIGCDFSYAPVFNITADYEEFFSVTIVGGYLDTGTPMFASGSFEPESINIVGLRNPSGAPISNKPTSNLSLTTGSARPKKVVPVSAVSYFETKQTNIDAFFRTSTSKPLPVDGTYTISLHITKNVGSVVAMQFNNTTTAETTNLLLIDNDTGYTSHTFKASAGDVITFVTDGDATCDVDIDFLYLTLGAGIYSAVEENIILGVADSYVGNGTPEGVVTASIGAMYRRLDGGASTTLYIKESGTGNTGWVAK